MLQIEASERLYRQLKEWQRPLEALEKLHIQLRGFDTSTTLLKTTAVNGLLATNIYALVAMAEHVHTVLDTVQVGEAGPELVDKIADFKHRNKQRENVSFASKFAHFFIDPDRFPMKDSFSTKMVEFHLGTKNCAQTAKKELNKSYSAFIQNIERLKQRDSLDTISHRQLDRYLWFAGKYRAFLKKPPFEKMKRAGAIQAQPVNDQQETQQDMTKLFLDVRETQYSDDLAAVLGS